MFSEYFLIYDSNRKTYLDFSYILRFNFIIKENIINISRSWIYLF